jgi:NitT/TauT family transport system substrate-binding protein/putative hydroxymethylpyrimidine transport system substrate-binding protein
MRRVLLLSAIVLAGCGGGNGDRDRPAPVTVALEFTPNPVHAPIYAARDDVPLDIKPPGSGPGSLKLVASGKVDLGVLDIHDLAIAREAGVDVVAVGALVGKPLAALVAQPGIRRPRDLEGRRVGVSGLPSDPAFLKAIVEHDGGDVRRVEQVTIGFTAVSRLLSRRVDAAPAFWNAEGVALRRRGLAVREFRVEDYGAPPYPEVVLITSRKTLARKRKRLQDAVRAIASGARRDPALALDRIAEAGGGDDRGLLQAQMDAVRPLFSTDLRADPAVLEAWAAWDAEVGIVREPPDVAAAFDFSLVE